MPQTQVNTKEQNAAGEFIAEQLPAWLSSASPRQLNALRSKVAAHHASQRRVSAVTQQLQPLHRFAKHHLEQAMQARMGLTLDLDLAIWREERRRLNIVHGTVREFTSYFVRVPALQKLIQNFKEAESFFPDTALVQAAPVGAGTEATRVSDIAGLVDLCRETDVGAAYQRHLAQVLTSDFERDLVADKRCELALAVEVAAMKRQLGDDELRMLRQVIAETAVTHSRSARVVVGGLKVLGCRVDGALAIELLYSWGRPSSPFPAPEQTVGVLLYLPDDAGQPLRYFGGWQAANQALVASFADDSYRHAIERRIALDDRVKYLTLLGKRLLDTSPDLQPAVEQASVAGIRDMAAWHVQRIKNDARFMAVPTAQADAGAAAQRQRDLENAGLALLGLASFFVPGIGELLLLDWGRRLLGQVYEGVKDWSQGHQHEALEHLLQLATELATAGLVTGGTTLARSAFFDALEPVTTEAGAQRLWRNDLQPYRQAKPSVPLIEQDDGLYSDGSGHWWRDEHGFYPVRQDAKGNWRLLHPNDPETYGPVLQGNGERAWRLSFERPLEWQGERQLLSRLWPSARDLDSERITQILKVADVDEAHLRGLLVQGRRLPVSLRDTLERFAVEARAQRFFEATTPNESDSELWQWCVDRLALASLPQDEQLATLRANIVTLRQPLLEHFSTRYLADDEALSLVKRDFSTLPDAYALEVLQQADETMRTRIRTEGRLPLALMERARSLLQEARLVRLREALYLQGSYRSDMVELLFALLRRHGLGQPPFNLMLRDQSEFGPVLARLYPEARGLRSVVLVWQAGGFDLYDENGLRSELEVAEPQGIFEVLAACLPENYRQRQGWVGEDAPARIRVAMQGWVPAQRQALLSLLGWREARALPSSLQRLADGRVGYLLCGRVTSPVPSGQVLRRRIRSLYPGFDEQEVERTLRVLMRYPGSAYSSLLRMELNYVYLDEHLNTWVRAVLGRARNTRREVADAFRRAWRLQGEQVVDSHGETAGLRLSIVGLPVGELPTLPAGSDFAHVIDLLLVGLHLQDLPAGFLRSFPGLRRLDLSNNRLSALPEQLRQLPGLRHLNLRRNRIRVAANQSNALAVLPHLRTLDLSENPLGTTSLHLNQLSRLCELRLFRCGLQRVPAGMEWLGMLQHVDLRNNLLDDLPETLLNAPESLRRAIVIQGNALPAPITERLYAHAVHVHVGGEGVEARDGDIRWLSTLEGEDTESRRRQWQALQREPGSNAFFQLLDELTEGSDYRLVRADLSRRVWAMIEALNQDMHMREELFELAADPRTCVDSVASCFAHLEVRQQVLQATHGGDPLSTRQARLSLARRLFRLDRVEALARQDFQSRSQSANAEAVDEVEISLAYRTGLSVPLDLIGQPRTMQFRAFAGVSRSDLDRVYQAVQEAEASDELAVFISQRDFWLPVLRALRAEDFEALEEQFDTKLQTLDAQKETLSSAAYVLKANKIGKDREAALEALALRLTREVLLEHA
ncbi:NEL-type E3 ubiquitin ligase domain-containing protein [Pseudomonas sp. NY11955]|uniref:NEL-type E3 ubiquitin ligase domain-containing protein n=1 Tax=Pseudomonas sp. NY11955 TaxID=3400363 RepID=UPI003A8BB2DE